MWTADQDKQKQLKDEDLTGCVEYTGTASVFGEALEARLKNTEKQLEDLRGEVWGKNIL